MATSTTPTTIPSCLLLAAAALVSACDHQPAAEAAKATEPIEARAPRTVPAAPPTKMPMTAQKPDVDLEWTLSKAPDGSRLQLAYRLRNTSGRKLFIADQLLEHRAGKIDLVPDRVIVTAGDAPDTVRFVRGVVRTGTTQFDHPPAAEALDPGAVREGHAEIALPLKGWHNYGTPPQLPAAPTHAVLEIAYLDGDSIQWAKVKTSSGAEVTIPQLPSYRGAAKLAKSSAKPLP